MADTSIIQTASQLKDANGYPSPIGGYLNITTTTTTTVKSNNGFLYSLIFNTPVAGSVITLYDSLTGSGTKIGTITIPASPQLNAIYYDINFIVGLTIVTATQASDITVTYR